MNLFINGYLHKKRHGNNYEIDRFTLLCKEKAGLS